MIRNIKASEGILVRSKTGINQVVPGQLEFPFCKMEMEMWLTVRKTASAQHSRSCRDCLLPPHASWRRHSCTETYLRARQLTNTHPGTAIWVKMPEFNLQAFLTYMNPNLYIMTTQWITQSFLKKTVHTRARNQHTNDMQVFWWTSLTARRVGVVMEADSFTRGPQWGISSCQTPPPSIPPLLQL